MYKYHKLFIILLLYFVVNNLCANEKEIKLIAQAEGRSLIRSQKNAERIFYQNLCKLYYENLTFSVKKNFPSIKNDFKLPKLFASDVLDNCFFENIKSENPRNFVTKILIQKKKYEKIVNDFEKEIKLISLKNYEKSLIEESPETQIYFIIEALNSAFYLTNSHELLAEKIIAKFYNSIENLKIYFPTDKIILENEKLNLSFGVFVKEESLSGVQIEVKNYDNIWKERTTNGNAIFSLDEISKNSVFNYKVFLSDFLLLKHQNINHKNHISDKIFQVIPELEGKFFIEVLQFRKIYFSGEAQNISAIKKIFRENGFLFTENIAEANQFLVCNIVDYKFGESQFGGYFSEFSMELVLKDSNDLILQRTNSDTFKKFSPHSQKEADEKTRASAMLQLREKLSEDITKY